MNMFNTPIVLVDVETTGSHKGNGRLTEVACIRVEDGQIVDEFESLVNPGQFIPYYIQNMTGISNEMVEDSPTFSEIAEKVNAITSDAVFIAHNVWFDYRFIQSAMQRIGKTYERDLLCTVRLSRKLFPNQASHGLTHIIEMHNLSCSARHRAYGDAKVLLDWLELVQTRFDYKRIRKEIKRVQVKGD